MKTAACYIRVSTDEQTEYSPDSQLKIIRDYAFKHDISLIEDYIFADVGKMVEIIYKGRCVVCRFIKWKVKKTASRNTVSLSIIPTAPGATV